MNFFTRLFKTNAAKEIPNFLADTNITTTEKTGEQNVPEWKRPKIENNEKAKLTEEEKSKVTNL